MKWKTLANKITNRIRSGSNPSNIENNQQIKQQEKEEIEKEKEQIKERNQTIIEILNMDNVQVSVRIRPLIREEREIETIAWLWENNMITQDITKIPLYKQTTLSKSALDQMQLQQSSSTNYLFDNLFCPEHTNEHIFIRIVKPVIVKAMQGYHGSIFSYGQTSSGKTFTMNGTSKQPGVIPLSIFECFESISQFRDREFLFRVSYLEIYNETVHDLLNPEVTQIKIQHDPKVGTVLVGAKEQVVMNPAQVIALLQGGEAHRHVGSTDMNEKSSRAHTLFRLIIESKALSDSSDVPIRVSTLNLVDLAGSESAKMTNSKGIRAREAKYINQSLLTLSTIIHRLSEEDANNSKSTQHLPYRDSKLTRILQTALSGNALISIICTISPTVKCFEESNNTLKFATRAKKIKMDAKVNETVDDKTLLRAYRLEIEQLKAKLAEVEQAMQTVKATEQIDPVENEENQLFMLQMIDHMERLILKGEEKAKVEESIIKERKTNEPKREMKSRKSEGLSNNGLRSSNSSRKLNASENNINSPASLKREISSNGNQLSDISSNDLNTTTTTNNNNNNNVNNKDNNKDNPNNSTNQKNSKESKIAVRNKKNISTPKLNEKKIPTPTTNTKVSSTQKVEVNSLNLDSIIVNDDKLNLDTKLKDENDKIENREQIDDKNNIENENEDDDVDNEDENSVENITTPRLNEIDIENEDFFAGINRNRESLLRASHDINDKEITNSPNKMMKRFSHSGLLNRDDLTSSSSFIIENILAGSRENLFPMIGHSSDNKEKSTDPVLEGVSQMLSILKQHVQKTKQSVGGIIQDGNDAIMNISKNKTFQRKSAPNLSHIPDEISNDANNEVIHKLKMELHLKEADNKFLQNELQKLTEHINSKDNMLNMLTEGLKEVEVNQANLLSANDSLSAELDVVHRAYEEVVSENEILKNEVRRLMICLDAREKQYFEATGRKLEEEEF